MQNTFDLFFNCQSAFFPGGQKRLSDVRISKPDQFPALLNVV